MGAISGPPCKLTFSARPGKLGEGMPSVYVAGAGMTRVGRRSEPLQELMADAAHGALAEAGIERPGMLVVAAMNPEEFLGDGNFASNVATYLGLADTPTVRVETATSVRIFRAIQEPVSRDAAKAWSPNTTISFGSDG